MKHIQLFEAYDLAKAKELTKAWKESGTESLYDDIFGKKTYRIYIPFTASTADKEKFRGETTIQENIRWTLLNNHYKIIDYYQGTASKVGDDKNVFKIGKLLQRIDTKLKAQFDSDPARAGYKMLDMPLEICISRHAYDIGGMSTGRGWTSCMDLVNGINRHYVKEDVKAGTLVAYLIRKNDKNLTNPISRVLIKPLTANSRDTTSRRILQPESKMYGFYVESVLEVITEWANNINKDAKYGNYELPGSLYNDGIEKNRSLAPEGYTVEKSYANNDLVVVRNNKTLHYTLLDGDGIEITNKEYSTLVLVDPQTSCIKGDEYEPNTSNFFYALEENINKTKKRSDLLVQIINSEGRVIIQGDLDEDYDLLYGYLEVRDAKTRQVYFIDSHTDTKQKVKKCINKRVWSVYTTNEHSGLFLVNRKEHKTYHIEKTSIRRMDLYDLNEINDDIVSVLFDSYERLLITIKDGDIEFEKAESITYTIGDKPLIKLDEDEYDIDMYAIPWNGGIKKFSLEFKEPEEVITYVRDGVEDTVIALEDCSFYSVDREEFLFTDLTYNRSRKVSGEPLVVIGRGNSYGLINLHTKQVLLPIDSKYTHISKGSVDTDYHDRFNIPKDLAYREIWLSENGISKRKVIDENGKFYN